MSIKWNTLKTAEDLEAEKIQQQIESRIREIKSELDKIDTLTIRPLRAKMAGVETEADNDKLESLELQAQDLREELDTLESNTTETGE